MNNVEITPDKERELRMLKAYFPFRICFAAVEPKTGETTIYAKHTRHLMNKLNRAGFKIFSI